MAINPLNNEKLLLERVVVGDERAFTELFDGYYGQIAEYIYKVTDSLEVTQEIVQDVFMKIWLQRAGLAEIKSFSNYLFILTRNQTVSFLRKKAREAVLQEDWEREQLEDDIFSPDDDLNEERTQKIRKIISALPPQQKKVLLLSRYHKLKHQEIADRLMISPETVKKHLQAAIKTIEKEIKGNNSSILLFILLSSSFIKP